MNANDRLRLARRAAGYASASEGARAMGVSVPTYTHHENGTREFDRETAIRYAKFYKTTPEWLHYGQGTPPKGILAATLNEMGAEHGRVRPTPNAGTPTPAHFDVTATLPVYGHAMGGEDGRFVMNGQHIADVLCPPGLYGVPDAYAVYVHGDSMEPRYFAGETVYVNPHMPVRRGDFVVAQIVDDADAEGPPLGYVKQFMSMNASELALRQINPPDGAEETMRFPRAMVVSVHKIVFAG